MTTETIEMIDFATQILTPSKPLWPAGRDRLAAHGDDLKEAEQVLNAPPTSIKWGIFEGQLTGASCRISTLHWLRTCFEPDPEMQAKLMSFRGRPYCGTWGHVITLAAQALSTDLKCRMTNTMEDPSEWDLDRDLWFYEVYAEGPYEPSHLFLRARVNHWSKGNLYSEPIALRIKDHNFREAAQIDRICSDFHVWWVDNGYVPASRFDKVEQGEIFSLPVINLDNVLEVESVRLLAQKQIQLLNTTTLDPRQRVEAETLLERGLESTVDIIVEERVEALGQTNALVIDGGTVKYFNGGHCHPITACNNYLG